MILNHIKKRKFKQKRKFYFFKLFFLINIFSFLSFILLYRIKFLIKEYIFSNYFKTKKNNFYILIVICETIHLYRYKTWYIMLIYSF
jgi:hypothetical protein